LDFVLIHGAYHGAWCWSRLADVLGEAGHTVVTVDLPISDPTAGLTTYRDTVVTASEGLAAPVVVGHSMGGVVVPLVAEARPVSHMVFLCAFLPVPGASVNDTRKSEPIETYDLQSRQFEDLGEGVWMVGPETARELFYHDAGDDLSDWAYARLRSQAYGVFSEPSPLRAWPDAPSSYILCREDRALDPEWSRSAARTRLGVEAIEIDGAHSPFLTRPEELAELLLSTV
jgi:pimeloyl-ACP methyl ester carboxylesterase